MFLRNSHETEYVAREVYPPHKQTTMDRRYLFQEAKLLLITQVKRMTEKIY